MHAAQGRTVDTAHTLVDSRMDRASFYVGMSRGVAANVAYVITGTDEHRLQRLSAVLDRDVQERAAITAQDEEFAAVHHLGRLGPEWATLVMERCTARYRDVLLTALGEERLARVDTDAAASALYRVLHTAELDGADVRELLTDAVQSRELDTADSIAEVLYRRVERELHAVTGRVERAVDPDLPSFTPRSYADRTPETSDDPVGRYMRELSTAMDERATVLAEQAAMLFPSWAEPLGPVPEDPLSRQEWIERAAAVASYREHFGQNSETEPIGRRPGFAEPERRAAWEQAAAALGMEPVERDLADHSDADLALRIEAYRREEAWMPPNVDDRLRSMSIAARESEGRVARLRAELEATGRYADDRGDLELRLATADAMAERTAQRAAELEAIANARALAVASVAGVEERARAAREELARRGVDPATWEPVTRDAASHTGRSTGPDPDGREAADQSEDARRAAEDRHIARDLARAREALERIEARAAQEQARQEPDIADRVPEQPIEPQRYHEPEPPVRPPEPSIERDGW